MGSWSRCLALAESHWHVDDELQRRIVTGLERGVFEIAGRSLLERPTEGPSGFSVRLPSKGTLVLR
jgi:hypothetical protein